MLGAKAVARVDPASTTVPTSRSVRQGSSLVIRRVTRPPSATQVFAMVSVRLAAPRSTPNSSAMGVKKIPAMLVMNPTVAIERPHIAATTTRCAPAIFWPFTAAPSSSPPLFRPYGDGLIVEGGQKEGASFPESGTAPASDERPACRSYPSNPKCANAL